MAQLTGRVVMAQLTGGEWPWFGAHATKTHAWERA